MKEFLKNTRDALAYSFSWLVICLMAFLLIRRGDTIRVMSLVRVFALCLWGAVCFALCFKNAKLQKKGFLFSLTCFYVLFIPVEIFLFYRMGIFQQKGSAGVWIAFAVITVLLYLTALLINERMKKKAAVYSEKLHEYQRQSRN